MESGTTYDAFISYNKRDRDVAAAIHRGLRRIGRKWYQVRALRVFFDKEDLPAGQHLTEALTDEAQASRYLVLVASKRAKESRYVDEEVAAFLATGDDAAARLLLATTDAELHWDPELGGFDPERSDLPPAAVRAFTTEPTRVDFGSAGGRLVDVSGAVDRRAIVPLAAPIHGLSPADLESQDSRARRIRQQILIAVATVVIVLAVLALWQWRSAVAQRRIADIRADSQQALADFSRSPALSLGLIGSAAKPGNPVIFESQDALVRIRGQLARPGPFLKSTFPSDAGPILAVDAHLESTRFVIGHFTGELRLWSLAGPRWTAEAKLPIRISDAMFLDADTVVVLGTDLERTRLFMVDFADGAARPLDEPTFRELPVTLDGFIGTLSVRPDHREIAVAVSNSGDCPGEERCGRILRIDEDGNILQETVTDDSSGIGRIEWLADGEGLVVGTGEPTEFEDPRNKKLEIWRGEPLAPSELLTGHLLAVEAATVDPEGRYVVSVAGGIFAEPEAYLWPTGRLDAPLRLPTDGLFSIADLAISPDGSRLAVATAGEQTSLAIWDVSGDNRFLEVRGPRTYEIGIGGALDLAFVSDTELVVGNIDGSARLVDLEFDGEPLGSVLRSAETSRSTAVAHASDLSANSIVALGAENGRLELWDLEERRLLATMPGEDVPRPISRLAFGGPGGERLIVSRSFNLNVTDLGGDVEIEVLELLGDAFAGSVEVLDVSNPSNPVRVGPVIEPPGILLNADLSPDGRLVVATTTGTDLASETTLWSTESGEPIDLDPETEAFLEGGLFARFHPDGRRLLFSRGDGSVLELAADTYELRRRFETGSDSRIDQLTLSGDGRTLAAASQSGELMVWGPGRWDDPPETLQKMRLTSIELSHDGTTLAAVASNIIENQLEFFDTGDGIEPIGRALNLREFVLADHQHLDLRATAFSIAAADELASDFNLDRDQIDRLLARSGRSPGRLEFELERTGTGQWLAATGDPYAIEESTGLDLVNLVDLMLRSGQATGNSGVALVPLPIPLQIAVDDSASPLVFLPLNGGGFQVIDVLKGEAACALARRYLTTAEAGRLADRPHCLSDESVGG